MSDYSDDLLVERAVENAKVREENSLPTRSESDGLAADAVYGQADRTVESADRFMRLRGGR